MSRPVSLRASLRKVIPQSAWFLRLSERITSTLTRHYCALIPSLHFSTNSARNSSPSCSNFEKNFPYAMSHSRRPSSRLDHCCQAHEESSEFRLSARWTTFQPFRTRSQRARRSMPTTSGDHKIQLQSVMANRAQNNNWKDCRAIWSLTTLTSSRCASGTSS